MNHMLPVTLDSNNLHLDLSIQDDSMALSLRFTYFPGFSSSPAKFSGQDEVSAERAEAA
jgi:hypothetical protein